MRRRQSTPSLQQLPPAYVRGNNCCRRAARRSAEQHLYRAALSTHGVYVVNDRGLLRR